MAAHGTDRAGPRVSPRGDEDGPAAGGGSRRVPAGGFRMIAAMPNGEPDSDLRTRPSASGPPPRPADPQTEARVRRARRTAIAGLTVGLVPCCPPAGFAGSMLGLLVLLRDRDRILPRPVRRLAIAAVLVGAIGSMLNAMVLERGLAEVAKRQEADIRDRVAAVFDRAGAGWPAPALETFAAGRDRPGAADLEVFVDEVERRFGAYRGLRIVASGSGGTTMRPTREAAVRFEFERDEVLGSLTLIATPALPLPRLSLWSITVEPGAGEVLRLGPPPDRRGTEGAEADRSEATPSGRDPTAEP